MIYVPCKKIVAKTKNQFWFGADYNMNIYRGCSHGCIYCDSRSDCYREQDFGTVKVKENALEVIKKDLSGLRRKGVVATGSMSDPYNPLEKELNLTGKALMLLDAMRFGVAVCTKSPLITRDTDILLQIAEHSPVVCKISLITTDDTLAAKIDEAAPLPSERLKAIAKLSGNGIFCGIAMMPLLPFINDTEDNITAIVKAAADCGARFILPSFGTTMRAGSRNYYYNRLDKHFPGLKDKYIAAYGDNYVCDSPKAKSLYRTFAGQCQKHNILFKMKDIVTAYKSPYSISQLDMFAILNNGEL